MVWTQYIITEGRRDRRKKDRQDGKGENWKIKVNQTNLITQMSSSRKNLVQFFLNLPAQGNHFEVIILKISAIIYEIISITI